MGRLKLFLIWTVVLVIWIMTLTLGNTATLPAGEPIPVLVESVSSDEPIPLLIQNGEEHPTGWRALFPGVVFSTAGPLMLEPALLPAGSIPWSVFQEESIPGQPLTGPTEPMLPSASPEAASPPAAPTAPPVEVQSAGRQLVIATYTTSLAGSPADRTHNVRLAASKISGQVIKPGEVFSFNRTVGPRSRKSGFKQAIIIANRKFVPGIGGGVCQVSSTLYNVALDAGMHIIERYPHSLPVKYVPPGRDASVNYGSADFRFKNTSPYPVKIVAVVAGKQLTITLLEGAGEH